MIKEEFLAKLKEYTTRLLRLADKYASYNNKNLSEVLNDELLKQSVLGGFDGRELKFSENSSANYCRDVFGIEIERDNFIASLSSGISFNSVCKNVKIKYKETPFIKLLRTINEQIKKIERKINREIMISTSEISSIDDVEETVRKLLELCINNSPNRNKDSFLIFSTYRIPNFVLKEKYGNKLNLLKELGLEKIYEPKTDEIKEDYTLYGFKENSLGFMLRKLLLLCMGLTGENRIRINYDWYEANKTFGKYYKFDDEWKIYIENCKKILKDEILKFIETNIRYYGNDFIVIEKDLKLYIYYRYHMFDISSGDLLSYDDKKIHYKSLIDNLAQLMYFGLVDINITTMYGRERMEVIVFI